MPYLFVNNINYQNFFVDNEQTTENSVYTYGVPDKETLLGF